MKLKIRNFSGINNEEIIFDGLTIMAGFNNTGKSTIGKILDAIFNSLNNIQEKRKQERFKAIIRRLQLSIDKFEKTIEFSNLYEISKELNDLESTDKDKIREIINKGRKNRDFNDISELIDQVIYVKKLSQNDIDRQIITETFNKRFRNQLNNIFNEEIAELILTIKNEETILRFKDNECIFYDSTTTINHPAFYLDNPFYLDQIGQYRYQQNNLEDALLEEKNNVIDSIIGSSKLKKVFEILNQIAPYQITAEYRDFFISEKGENGTLNIANVSTGIKSFLILKRLIENGNLNEKDILILDEPEIHLHPEWQIVYAELIVILEKEFNLTIFITSHSPYFLEALEIFTKKYERINFIHYYLATKNDKQIIEIEETKNTKDIFKLLASPFQKLEKIEYELSINEQ